MVVLFGIVMLEVDVVLDVVVVLGETGVLDVALPKPLAATIFGRARHWPVLLVVCASLLAMVAIEARAARRHANV